MYQENTVHKTKYRIENNNVVLNGSHIAKCLDDRGCLEAIYVIEGSKAGHWYSVETDGSVVLEIKDEETCI